MQQKEASPPVIRIEGLCKTYEPDFTALDNVSLAIERGEIFALLGPNGAGKTTLISIVCGITNPSAGRVLVNGKNIIADYRATRSVIGLVPQELTTDAFETVRDTVSFSRGLFGKKPDRPLVNKILKQLTLWDKRDEKIKNLSGGMKRRVLIAKALSHEPDILFLDEPTAGVDVDLRKDMWQLVRGLQETGVTIILTTHYIEEAEEMADRIGIINKGKLVVVEDKSTLMQKLGKKQLFLELLEPLATLPPGLSIHNLELTNNGNCLVYTYDTTARRTGIASLLRDLETAGIRFCDLNTRKSSLEDIFVNLVKETT